MHNYQHQAGVFGIFWDIYAPTNVCVKDIGSQASMVLQNYQKFIVLTSNMFYIVAFGVGLKCPCKIHLNTQCPPPQSPVPTVLCSSALLTRLPKPKRSCLQSIFFENEELLPLTLSHSCHKIVFLALIKGFIQIKIILIQKTKAMVMGRPKNLPCAVLSNLISFGLLHHDVGIVNLKQQR